MVLDVILMFLGVVLVVLEVVLQLLLLQLLLLQGPLRRTVAPAQLLRGFNEVRAIRRGPGPSGASPG